jgi:hypothetical protein
MPAITITLADRVRMHAEAVTTGRAKLKQVEKEIEMAMDALASAEAEVLNHGPGWEGVELSGLIEEGKNPHYEKPKSGASPAMAAAAAAGHGGQGTHGAHGAKEAHHPLHAKSPEPDPEPEDDDEGEDDDAPKSKKGKKEKP